MVNSDILSGALWSSNTDGVVLLCCFQADVETEVSQGVPKKRTFKKFSFRGVDLDALLDMSTDELVKLFSARARRRFQRGLTRKPMALIKKLRKAVSFSVVNFICFRFCCLYIFVKVVLFSSVCLDEFTCASTFRSRTKQGAMKLIFFLSYNR